MPIWILKSCLHFYASHILVLWYFTSDLGYAEIRKEGRPRSILASMPRNKNTYTRAQGLMYEAVCNHSACLTLFPIWLEEAASESYSNSPSGLQTVDIQCVLVGRGDGNTSRLPHVQRCDSSFPTVQKHPVDLFWLPGRFTNNARLELLRVSRFWGKGREEQQVGRVCKYMKLSVQICGVNTLYYKLHESE